MIVDDIQHGVAGQEENCNNVKLLCIGQALELNSYVDIGQQEFTRFFTRFYDDLYLKISKLSYKCN